MLVRWLLLAAFGLIDGSQVLVPPDINIALNKRIYATATCGEMNGEAYKETFCHIGGLSQYTPLNQYAYTSAADQVNGFREMKIPKPSFIQGGQGCDYCEANTSNEHPAEFMVDGRSTWWQSPPLSRGNQYEQVNITIDLGQEFHVAYVWIQMANSPKPGKWVLERSTDYGATYTPWQYFAENAAECQEFGKETLAPIFRDDSVICSTDFSSITPLENAEMMIRLLENRPGQRNFSHSESLQNFAKATNVRLRLLRVKTLHGHLISVQKRKDPSVTRRHFYAIKEIFMGGRCVCNGHAATCDVLDAKRPNMLLCRCEHNTCGDQCERCCPGFEQKKWQRAMDNHVFKCEPCNCHGHSTKCEYDEELDRKHLSLDINGQYNGGGRCLDCQHHTEGINCNKCAPGYYRPPGKNWTDTDVCQRCMCDPRIHENICEEETGRCMCKPQFIGPNCDQCASGYYSPPACLQCDCSAIGTENKVCLPENGQCPCKPNFAGQLCNQCAPGFTNYLASCVACNCNEIGSVGRECDLETGQCQCRSNFAGLLCDRCADGYYDYPSCKYCNCDPSGSEGGLCDKTNGTCLCKPGYIGSRCDQCDSFFYGYPNCQSCDCDPNGSSKQECELTTGECTCLNNFIGQKCDRCKPGYYEFPDCKACKCHVDGSKGVTCNKDGQCFCKDNFQGDKCDECKPNFYNFPLCEECLCDPSGVSREFGGCDKVAPGKLCECKKNVEGRICNRCKPSFWGLNFQLDDGCESCDCDANGTVGGLNTCDPVTGQCLCKAYASGRKCNLCAEGFYNLQGHNVFGCQPCNCNKGGSFGPSCDLETGQCNCRPRITGLKCDRTINDHYTPTLWHNKYEAEDGRTPDGQPVRYASDQQKFENFSSRGFAVFSETQEEILITILVNKSTFYQVLLVYILPQATDVDIELTIVPHVPSPQNVEQSISSAVPQSSKPVVIAINKPLPFALNPGYWTIHIKFPRRLFLDYIVLLPSEYYEGSLLKEVISEPCKINRGNEDCLKTLYPPLPFVSRINVDADQTLNEVDSNGNVVPMEKISSDVLPNEYGKAASIVPKDKDTQVQVELKVPETGDYLVVTEYVNFQPKVYPITVEVQLSGNSIGSGSTFVEHCPYEVSCRNLFVDNGTPKPFHLDKDNIALVTITIPPSSEFGLKSINLVRTEDWDHSYLQQMPVCIQKDGKCVEQTFPSALNEVVKEMKPNPNLEKSEDAEKAPFAITGSPATKGLLLDQAEKSFEIQSKVSEPGQYVFIVHYYNPENPPTMIPVYLTAENFHDCILPVDYCPNLSGCRSVIQDPKHDNNREFPLNDKFEATFGYNSSQKSPIYIKSVTAVPRRFYTDALRKPLAIDSANKFIAECGVDEFMNSPSTVTDYCKENIFSLTSEFNSAGLPCKCNHEGSKSFSCDKYGGQCSCRPHIIGRQCNHCEPGYYGFPYCRKCSCLLGQTCDEKTGQCYCPRYVEGKSCDRCVQYAYGYDPLIGCQLCQCHRDGLDAEQGSSQCDANTGQCFCKPRVGGRKCDQCLDGYYGFPYCYPCVCDKNGTTEKICDSRSSSCICKENVEGSRCNQCKTGKFNLEGSNMLGCSDCFCFGATDRCISSDYPIDYLHFDPEAWRVTDLNGVVKHDVDRIYYFSSPEKSPSSVYYSVPIGNKKDFTTSYGLKISFQISSQPKGERELMIVAPDVRLIGYNMTLDYWVSEVPTSVKDPFLVVLKLIPESFIFENGMPVKRSDLMMALSDLKEILVKASYYEETDSAALMDFEMETAANVQGRYSLTFNVASSVEVCDCPAPYTGDSCQYCADGFYRVKTGNYLGACVACDCNGHAATCDKDTGVCHDCQHFTSGDHCEVCEEGYYGNATIGTYGCLPCPCPSIYQNYALGCTIDERGVLDTCICRKGYTGARCDQCDTGYYGQPNQANGYCAECSCNENNDLSIEGSCDTVTGHCSNCSDHTAGDHCEFCEQWYYGDAIEAKNCTDCGCDHCGSSYCDQGTGDCVCKPNVVGTKCDHCVENAWGFSRCNGCEMCNCGLASWSKQCDSQTGQCHCMPGAAGKQCETCDYGYWNYSSSGCLKCDCEADLSLGTVCDVTTGHCHCQDGATGPRCDQCLTSYLRIPDYGCRRCDECVYSLVNDLDELDVQRGVLLQEVQSFSPSAFASARLGRISKNIGNYNALLDDIVSLKNNNSFEEVKEKFDAQKKYVVMLAESAKDQDENAMANFNSMEKVREDFSKFRTKLEHYQRLSGQQVAEYEKFIDFVHDRMRDMNIVELEQNGQMLLERLEHGINVPEELREFANSSENNLNVMRTFLESLAAQKKFVDDISEKASLLNYWIIGYRMLMDDFTRNITKTDEMSKILGENKKGMAENIKRMLITADELSTVLAASDLAINATKGKTQTCTNAVNEIKMLMEHLSNISNLKSNKDRLKRSINENTQDRVNNHVKELEEQAKNLSIQFGTTKQETDDAMKAAYIYKDLLATLKSAHAFAISAKNDSEIAKTKSKDLPNLLEKLEKEYSFLHSSMAEVNRTVAKEAEQDSITGKKINELQNMLKDQKTAFEKWQLNPRNDSRMESFAETEKDFDKADNRLSKVKTGIVNLMLGMSLLNEPLQKTSQENKNLRRNIDDTEKNLARVMNTTNDMKSLMESVNETIFLKDKLKQFKESLKLLKEKIASARDQVHRVRLTVNFDKGSSLELPLPQHSSISSAYIKAQCFIKSTVPNGLILFYGNEKLNGEQSPTVFGDYMTLAVKDYKPYLTLSLGDGPKTMHLDQVVSDNEWWKLIVEHVDHKMIMSAQKAGTLKVIEKTEELGGRNRVLNIHKDSARLFVGGIPKDVKMPLDQPVSNFVGEIDDLILNGEYVPLWDLNRGRSTDILGSRIRPQGDAKSASAMTFIGDGYAVMGVYDVKGPQRANTFALQFRTYSANSLIYFAGNMDGSEFMALELLNGAVRLHSKLSSGEMKVLTSASIYNDGELHNVEVSRRGRYLRLSVDGERIDGAFGGSEFELDLGREYYLGGLPHEVPNLPDVIPYSGCIQEVKIDSISADLTKPKASRNVSQGCAFGVVRIASFPVDESQSIFDRLTLRESFKLVFNFKTDQPLAHLATIQDSENKNLIILGLENGLITVSGVGIKKRKIYSRTIFDNSNWHTLATEKDGRKLRVSIDDYALDTITITDDKFQSGITGMLQFGSQSNGELAFHGCISDVILDGVLLNFKTTKKAHLHLSKCHMADSETEDMEPPVIPTSTSVTELTTTMTTTTIKTLIVERDLAGCALSIDSAGDSGDLRGQRFGLASDSRLEFRTLSKSFDKTSDFSLEIRPTALNGIILLSISAQGIDYISVYLVNGSVHFGFNSGRGAVILQSKRYLLDGNWHRIVAERHKRKGSLTVDGVKEDYGETPPGSSSINTEPPLYIGGLPKDAALGSLVAKKLGDIPTTFVGCMRNFTLNGVKLENPVEHKLASCSETTERGNYFGKGKPYMIMDRYFSMEGTSLFHDLELRPRTKNAVLLSANGVDSYTMQLLDGQIVVKVIQNGNLITVRIPDKDVTPLCDGHWHTVKFYILRGVLVLSVDKAVIFARYNSVNTLRIEAPLYFGGVPQGTNFKSLDTTESYAGCARLHLARNASKTPVNFTKVEIFGDIRKDSCPVA